MYTMNKKYPKVKYISLLRQKRWSRHESREKPGLEAVAMDLQKNIPLRVCRTN